MRADRPVRPATAPKSGAKKAGEGCRVGDLFRLLGESHVLDILYVFIGDAKPRRFVEVQRELHLSPNTLSDRLRNLVEAGLLSRQAFNETPPRVEYRATRKAIEFGEVFQSLSAWAERNSLTPEPVVTPAP